MASVRNGSNSRVDPLVSLGKRSVLAYLLASLLVHVAGVAWISSAWAGRDAEAGGHDREEDERADAEEQEQRLGIESSERVTIDWLGFADPTLHWARESEVQQSALVMSPPGASEAPSTPLPSDGRVVSANAPDSEIDSEADSAASSAGSGESELAPDVSPDESTVRSAAGSPGVETDGSVGEKVQDAPGGAGEANPSDPASTPDAVTALAEPVLDASERPSDAEDSASADSGSSGSSGSSAEDSAAATDDARREDAEDADGADTSAVSGNVGSDDLAEGASPAALESPREETAGTDSMEGILSDREATPTSKPIELEIQEWGKTAAGEGIDVKPARPRFPDTVAVTMRLVRAVVLIDFGADGFVREVRWDTKIVNRRRVELRSGNPLADNAIWNAVHNWTASGVEIDRLKDRGPGAVLTVRMEISARP